MKFLSFIGIILGAMLATGECAAQTNLVPNPGFELRQSFGHCPLDTSLSFYSPEFWDTLSLGSSDYLYLNACSIWSGAPENVFGYQYPFEGNAYMLFGTDSDTSITTYREYFQNPLISSLFTEFKYCYSAWGLHDDSVLRAIDDFNTVHS